MSVSNGANMQPDPPESSVAQLSTGANATEDPEDGREPLNVRQASRDGDLHKTETSEPSMALLQETGSEIVSLSEKATCGRQRYGYFISSWWQEFASWFVSSLALVAMCITLAPYAHKPSPDWPTWLSLNTIVSIYSAVLKTGILLVVAQGSGQSKWSWLSNERSLIDLVGFDDASRGPTGAMRLLWMLRSRYLTASCGALLAILVLAADPLAQQMLRYYDCSVSLTTEQGSIPRTNFFYDFDAAFGEPDHVAVSPRVQTPVISGILGESTAVNFECSTGNCTWTEEYSTFGYCSKCNDISDQLSIRNISSNSSFSGWAIETSIPGGLSIEYPGQNAFHLHFAKIGKAAGPCLERIGVDFVVASKYDTADQAGRSCSGGADETSKWKCRGYGAARCYVYPCVKTYAASMNAGVLTEILLDTSDNWSNQIIAPTTGTPFGAQYGIVDTHCITRDERQSLQDLGYTVTADQRWLPYNLTTFLGCCKPGTPLHLNDTFPDSMIRRDCVYAYSYQLSEAIDLWFTLREPSGLFTGNVYGGSYEGNDNVFYGSQVAQAFYNFGNAEFNHVESLFKNGTDPLTKYMRQNSEPRFSKAASGVVKENKACVDVRWAWLAYLAALLLLASIFLALIAFETRPSAGGPAIWKSTPLALLYHGFNTVTTAREETDDVSVNLRSIQGMEQCAKRTVIQLQDSGFDDARLVIKN